jgi:hypothetical protein
MARANLAGLFIFIYALRYLQHAPGIMETNP